jgi:signal transduction histidine kinase
LDTALKINIKSLKFQSWLYLMIFSIAILAVLWVLQFLFLDRFYESMKLNEIKKTGEKISEHFGEGDFHTIMDVYAFNNNLRIITLDESGQITWSFDGFPSENSGRLPPGELGRFPQSSLRTAVENLKASRSDSICYIDTNNRLDFSQAVYVARLIDSRNIVTYVYISSPIPPIDSTISVLKTQFFIITAILFVLSLIMAQWFSKKLSRPIVRLTESAERVVRGELDATFYEDGFTEIHQLASALNYATGKLRNLDKYRRDFIANITHDLKTPLTIIKLNGELIKDVSGDDPEKRAEHCNTIISEADWLTNMVKEILELSKLESNYEEFAKTRVNLSLCLIETLGSFRVLEEKDGYIFEVQVDENLFIYGNEPMLKRAIYSLISNAVNFTGEDKRVILSLKNIGGRVRFEVTDTGEGIPKEMQGAIWDRYYKSKNNHKRAIIGTGIGLSIVKNILILHGADYGVISEIGKGSTFWFELPFNDGLYENDFSV